MIQKILLIEYMLLSIFSISVFSQNIRTQQRTPAIPPKKTNFSGSYILSFSGSLPKNNTQNPSGKLLVYGINDSTYKIKLRYTGAPPAKNIGVIDDIIFLKNNKASYTTKEDNTCKIIFLFTESSVTIEQQSESNAFACGFGRNVHVDGLYIKDKTIPFVSSPLKAGKTGITLQWIGMEKRGIAQITDAKNGFFQIQGRQDALNGKDYLEIMGILYPSSAEEIIFEGIIRTSVSYINKGNVCERKGKYTFVAKPGKKYWRLKESKNCEGGMVTDYIDLYF